MTESITTPLPPAAVKAVRRRIQANEKSIRSIKRKLVGYNTLLLVERDKIAALIENNPDREFCREMMKIIDDIDAAVESVESLPDVPKHIAGATADAV